jgi:16S rRNA (cytosine967-C5)-methyltransferase
MAISPARIAAFEILLRADRHDSFASELLHSSQYAALSPADHRLATELTMGVLRWRSLLDQWISQESSVQFRKLDVEVLISLRLASYQLLFLDRIPQRAAIYESVELVKRARKRSATAFVNALLRKLEPKNPKSFSWQIPQSTTVAELAQRSSHPQWLVERWDKAFGFEIAKQICAYDQQIPATSLAILDSTELSALENSGTRLSPGLILSSSRRVEKISTKLRETAAVIQDEASQLVALLVGQGSRILDCCAAPGGKTRLIARLNPESTIIAADLHRHRASLLRKLVPDSNVHVVVADARTLPIGAYFDCVLVDAPCSGTGTLARNPDIKWRLTEADLRDLQSRQIAILGSAMRRVAPGGKLIYSTCSLEREENERVLDAALKEQSSFRILDCRPELDKLRAQGSLAWENVASLTDGPFLRTLPGVHPCDGFFAAILGKS